MLLWSLAIFSFLLGTRLIFREVGGLHPIFAMRSEGRTLQRVIGLLHEIQETLETGLLPKTDRWDALDELPSPWGKLAGVSLRELRKGGAPILPTLKRIRELAHDHDAALKDARAKSAQALSQALVCSILVPVFGATLYLLMPGVAESYYSWILGCVLAFVWTGAGAVWLLSMSEEARWAGLDRDERTWVLGAQCSGERFLALVRSGMPADLSWVQACELLSRDSPGLAEQWGHSVWVTNDFADLRKRRSGAAQVLLEVGSSLKKSIQASLMEGRPCTERVEATLLALRRDLRAQIEREISLLGTRALKPLFFCVAPSLMGLLALGLYLGWAQAIAGQ